MSCKRQGAMVVQKNEILLFEASDKSITLPVKIEQETVWLSANQMAVLFDRDEKTVRKHINNVFSEDEVEKVNNTQKMRVDGVKQLVPFYSLDVIISVGYRVKSKRGVEFRSTKRLGWRFLRKKRRQKQSLFGKHNFSNRLCLSYILSYMVRDNIKYSKKRKMVFTDENCVGCNKVSAIYQMVYKVM